MQCPGGAPAARRFEQNAARLLAPRGTLLVTVLLQVPVGLRLRGSMSRNAGVLHLQTNAPPPWTLQYAYAYRGTSSTRKRTLRKRTKSDPCIFKF